MCIINFHIQDHPIYKFILAANRDEFFKRPTQAASFWQDEPDLLAGRDLEAMGTWLGVTKTGKFAALTNYRDIQNEQAEKVSRGKLVTDFLTSSQDTKPFLEALHKNNEAYNGFNLLAGTIDELSHYSNYEGIGRKLPAGTHAVSNHLLNTPWPKVIKAKDALRNVVKQHTEINPDDLFDLLHDKTLADDAALPDTGVAYELEKQLSSVFIEMPDYGTRSSTVILVTHDNDLTFIERTFSNGNFTSEQNYTFKIKNPSHA